MDGLLPIGEEDLVDTLAWSILHRAGTVRSLLNHSTSLETCRHIAGLQLEYLRRAGVLTYRRPAVSHGHFRVGPRDE